MQVDHEKSALSAGYIVEFIHDATENYYEGGTYACRNCNNIKEKFVLTIKERRSHLATSYGPIGLW